MRFGDADVPAAADAVPSNLLSSSSSSSPMDTDTEGDVGREGEGPRSAESLHLSMTSLQKMCVAFRLGSTPADVSTVAALVASDDEASDSSSRRIGINGIGGGGQGAATAAVEEELERAPPVSGTWRLSPGRFATLFKVDITLNFVSFGCMHEGIQRTKKFRPSHSSVVST